MKNALLITITLLLLSACQESNVALYTANKSPLAPNAFIELPLGAIRPEGWLKEKFERQRDGLTGNLDELYPLVMGDSNGWLGGEGDQWERGPYWIDGLLPLAYMLDDKALIAKTQRWIEWALNSQQPNGYFGPSKEYPNDIPGVQRDNCDDWWPKMVMLKVLQQYYSATQDERVVPFMTNYFHYQLENLPANPLDFRTFWPRYRGGDNLMVVLWLYNITEDAKLLELADILYEQTFDYVGTFAQKNWWTTGSMHCVNLAQGIKTPAIYAQYRDREANLASVKSGFNDITTFLGYPHGGFGGDEALHGNNPTQGTELCTLVEYMFSLEKIVQISGDMEYAEHLERLAFNALPAQSDDDYMSRQYFQQTNQVCVNKQDRNFDTNHAGTDILFSLLGGYPCCTSNMHQALPKFAQNLWYATADNGLAAAIYSPSTVVAKVANGEEVKIEEVTNYPFSETIEMTIRTNSTVTFPLYLRIPSWCTHTSIEVNNAPFSFENNSGLASINREWQDGDKVTITLPMEVRLTSWYERSLAVEHGALVYALQMEENKVEKSFEGEDRIWFGDTYTEITSNSPWNYALVECDNPASQYQVERSSDVALFPWNQANAPIEIKTIARKVPNWTLYNGSAGAQPYSIAYGIPMGEMDTITLIPYGCTKLRITEFPVTGNYTIK